MGSFGEGRRAQGSIGGVPKVDRCAASGCQMEQPDARRSLKKHQQGEETILASREAIKGGNPLNRRLGTVEESPFFGVRLYPGVFVSSGGVRTNRHGQAVDAYGGGIRKLYAIGNTSAHLEYGIGYQAGYSLTSGMTFGYLAVQHILSET